MSIENATAQTNDTLSERALAHSEETAQRAGQSLAGRLGKVWREDTREFHFRMVLANALLFFLPHLCFNRLRTAIYRLLGIRLGPRTLVLGRMELEGGCPWRKFAVGSDCRINTPFYVDLNAPVTIGNNVGIGHHVVLVTTDHDVSSAEHRAGTPVAKPIVLEDGCMIAAGVTIMPGVTIGRGSVVSAGSLVSADVPPNRLVGGVPARPIKALVEERS